MAVAFVGATVPSGQATATSVTVNVPSGVAAGHILLVAVRSASASAVITEPAGWTAIAEYPYTGTSLQGVGGFYYRIAGSSEPASYTWNFSVSERVQGGMVAYSGADIAAVGSAWEEVAGSSNHKAASVTLPSAVTGGVVVNLATCVTSNVWSGGTNRWSGSLDRIQANETTGVTASAGTYTPPDLTHGGSSHSWAAATIVLRPAVTTPSVTAAFTGSGTLSASTVAVAARSAGFTGSGALTASVAAVAVVTAAFTGSGTLSAEVQAVGAAPQVSAAFTGAGTLTADVSPVVSVDAEFTGFGTLTASSVATFAVDAAFSGNGTLAAAAEVPGADSEYGGPVDLSTFVNLTDTEWTGTYLARTGGASGYADFTFPRFLDPAKTYQLDVDYAVPSGSSGAVELYSLLGPTTDDYAVSAGQWLGVQELGLSGTGTVSVVIGPGIGDWDLAVADGEHYATFSIGGLLRVTGITLTAIDPPIVVTDPTRLGGRSRGGYAAVEFTPTAVEPPTFLVSGSHRRIRAAAFGAVTLRNGLQPVFTVAGADTARERTQIIVGGKDISFLYGAPTPEPGYQLAEPLLWGPCSIDVPQVVAAYAEPGVDNGIYDLRWCAIGKAVRLKRPDGTDYRGVVIGHDLTGKDLRIEAGGHGQGRAALDWQPTPIFKDRLDLGRLAWAAVRSMGLAFTPRLGPTTGIKHANFGGTDLLTHIQTICAKAFNRDGAQWTIMPDEAGVYSMVRKDRTTVDFTVFHDDARNVASLRSDAAERPNKVYASGVTPRGQRVRFGVYPQLKPGPVAPYPFEDGRNFGIGTTDEDTDTGDGITLMLRKLWQAGFLSLEEANPGDGYDSDAARAVKALKRKAGLFVTGEMTEAAWAALYDVATTGYTVRGSQVEPAAQADNVRRYDRSASGQILGRNETFDKHALVVARYIDFESGLTRHEMREHSEAVIDRAATSWHGTLTIHTGAVLAGDVAIGATPTEADLRDVRWIKPGMNVRLPLFAGGIVLHVSGVEITRTEGGHPVAQLTVDTEARDAPEVWEMIRRRKETRSDPARRWKGGRASSTEKDSITPWDEVGGVLYGDRELVAGWNVVEVVAGQEGTVSDIRLVVQQVTSDGGDVIIDPREFACAVFGKPVTAARLNALVANPLSEEGTKKWRRQATRQALNAHNVCYSADTYTEPCGYGADLKTDDAPLTGVHEDEAGFSYRTHGDPVLYVAIWVADDGARLLGGRVMWNQLEAGA